MSDQPFRIYLSKMADDDLTRLQRGQGKKGRHKAVAVLQSLAVNPGRAHPITPVPAA